MIDWLEHYEPLWLFVILIAGLIIEFHSNYMLRKEFEYDEQKDLAKKQKRTKTTKKTTTEPSGSSTIEETTEVVEPTEEKK